MQAYLPLLFMLWLAGACVAGDVESYVINAQVSDSGANRKLSSLGDATLSCGSLGGSEFRVKIDAAVKDPRDGRLYEFHVDHEYVAAGTMITAGRDRSRYNAAAQEYRARVETFLPFIWLVKAQPGQPGSERAYRYHGTSYTMRYRDDGRRTEAALYEGDTLLGKFFLVPGDVRTTLRQFDKFRVATTGRVSLTFARR